MRVVPTTDGALGIGCWLLPGSEHHAHMPMVAIRTLVAGSTEPNIRRDSNSAKQIKPDLRQPRQPPTFPQALNKIPRMQIIRQHLRSNGLPSNVVELVLKANRKSTQKSNDSAWNVWCNWALEQGHNPLSPSLNVILEFLTFQVELGKSFNTVSVYKFMLSSTLPPIEGVKVGKHSIVSQLIQGAFNTNPPVPKYTEFWDLNDLLKELDLIDPDSLDLAQLSCRLATLLATATFMRVSELSNISLPSVKITRSSATFSLSSLSKPRKAQRSGPLQSFNLRRLPSSGTCPVHHLELYFNRTESLRDLSNSTNLFIGIRKPHKIVGPSTVARWIKSQLSLAGVDCARYSAHSTRGAAASAAVVAGVPIQSILDRAGWSSESTFTRFYRRNVSKGSHLFSIFVLILLAPLIPSGVKITCQCLGRMNSTEYNWKLFEAEGR